MYQALYRQYRPKTFDELLGQNHINTTLKNQINRGSIGHAYLFSGTRGTGKTSAAKIFSRAVNCLDIQDGNPCNRCSSCIEILEESAMDVIEMDAASNNSVEDIREIRDRVVYPPSNIKYKVYIIDEIHMLSKGAFNALLKTLEEPPEHLIFILATTEPERLPQTILSRCQRFDFKRINIKDLIDNMENILSELDINMEDRALRLIARNSDGSMRDALSLLDQCLSFNNQEITYEDTINILGIANIDLIFDIVDNIKNRQLEKALLAVDNIIQSGKDIHQFIQDLIEHFRNLMVISSSKDLEEFLDIDDIERYKEQGKNMDLNHILKSLEILTEAEAQGKWSSNIRIILEMAIIKMIKIEDSTSLEERIKKLEEGYIPARSQEEARTTRRKPVNKIVKKEENQDQEKDNQKESTRVEDPIVEDNEELTLDKELTLDTIKEHWPKVIDRIKSDKIRIYALIREGSLISFVNNQLTIAYKEGFGFHRDAIDTEDNKRFMEEIVSKFFSRDISINFIMSNNHQVKEEPKKENKEESIEKVIDFFGEDIVEIE